MKQRNKLIWKHNLYLKLTSDRTSRRLSEFRTLRPYSDKQHVFNKRDNWRYTAHLTMFEYAVRYVGSLTMDPYLK
jgi:hypothetical protein